MGVLETSDFRPPYRLGAFGCVIIGTWEARASELLASSLPVGLHPLHWRGGSLGTALVLRYDRPPLEHPIAYNEVIAACVVRCGARSAAVPFDLVLDDEFLVRAGRQHYHLPKRFDPTLRVEVVRDDTGEPERMTATAADVAFEANLRPTVVARADRFVASIFRTLTEQSPILGAADEPVVWSSIPIRPDASTARTARVTRLAVGGHTLRPLYAQFWASIAITVSAPRTVISSESAHAH